MGHGYDICPKCGCDLWKEYSKAQRKKQQEKYPNDCYCFSFDKRGKRDHSKDTLIEKKMIDEWTGPLTNTRRKIERDIFKCHLCGKRYIYPELFYA